MIKQINPSRPVEFEDRFRLYLDESGDHVYRETTETAHRFLCLLGCWFKNPDYIQFHESLENFKGRHFHHHPDNHVILQQQIGRIWNRVVPQKIKEPLARLSYARPCGRSTSA